MIDLSLCMIVKNEEKNLPDCLRSVKDVVNEIIIVDTGSTDKTIQVALDFNADVIKTEWKNSFSVARNLSISQALGKWILYLDADERLEPTSTVELLSIVQTNAHKVYSCLIKSEYKIFDTKDEIRGNRLFRNHSDLFFQNLVHEEIWYSAKRLGFTGEHSNIIINHLGYSADLEVMQKKAQRNLELLLAEIKILSTPLRNYEIAQSYGILGDLKKVREYLIKVKSFGKKNVQSYHWEEAEKTLNQLRKIGV